MANSAPYKNHCCDLFCAERCVWERWTSRSMLCSQLSLVCAPASPSKVSRQTGLHDPQMTTLGGNCCCSPDQHHEPLLREAGYLICKISEGSSRLECKHACCDWLYPPQTQRRRSSCNRCCYNNRYLGKAHFLRPNMRVASRHFSGMLALVLRAPSVLVNVHSVRGQSSPTSRQAAAFRACLG